MKNYKIYLSRRIVMLVYNVAALYTACCNLFCMMDLYNSFTILHRAVGIALQFIIIANHSQGDSENTGEEYNNSEINKGVCLTTICENDVQNTGLEINKDLESSLEGCLRRAISSKYDLFAKVNNIDCDTHMNDGYKIDSVDYIVAVIFIGIFLANIIGSCYDIFHKSKGKKSSIKGHELLLCFSIFRNIKGLSTEVFRRAKLEVVRDLHVVRTITACAFVYVNVIFMANYGFKTYEVEETFRSIPYQLSPSGLLIAQTFFFVTGFLITLITQPKPFNIYVLLGILIIRWWRLVPRTALVMAFSATWLRHVSSSPQWNIHSTAEHCRRHYWTHLFYYNNHLPNNTLCSFQNWYMTADTHLFALSIFIKVFLKNRSTMFKVVTFALLLSIGIASPALHIWFQDLGVSQRSGIYAALYELIFHKLLVLPNDNFICYIMSIATGYFAFYLHESKIKWPKWKTGRFLCWCVIPGIACVVYSSGEGRWSAALSGVRMAVVGGMCSLWVLGMVMKFNDFSALLKIWGWVALSKLSSTMCLLHPIVVFLVLKRRTDLEHESFANMNTIFIVVLLGTYALAWPFYLLVEAPSLHVIKLLVYRHKLLLNSLLYK